MLNKMHLVLNKKLHKKREKTVLKTTTKSFFPRVSSLHTGNLLTNTIYIFGYNTSEETRLKKTHEVSKSYHIAGIYVIFHLRCTRLHRTCYKLISSFLMCRNIICVLRSVVSSLHVHWTTLNTTVVYILLQADNSNT